MVPFTNHSLGYIKNPDLGNKIHCVAFVIDGSTVDVMSDKIRKQLKDLQITVNQRGKLRDRIGDLSERSTKEQTFIK